MKQATGTVVRAVGVVVDVAFTDAIPNIYSAVTTQINGETCILEVQSHVGDNIVRCVAMSSTDGIKAGQEVTDTGAPIQTPVGEAVLGRVLNVTGQIIDGGKPLPAKTETRSIHAKPPTW